MTFKFAPKKKIAPAVTSSKVISPPAKTVPSKPIAPNTTAPAKAISKVSPSISPTTRPSVPKASVAPLKTTLQRPVLRAFECLVNVEHAMKSLQGVGIYVGDDAEKQQELVNQITQDLIQLHLSYKTYWKQVTLSTGEKE